MKLTALIALIITAVLTALVIGFGLSVLLAYPVKWLWNATLPELFGFKEIGVWMAWKLSFLSALLIKGSTSTTKSSS